MAKTPEQKAPITIDSKWEDSGWVVQDRHDLDLKALGTIEAKAISAFAGVKAQSAKYTADQVTNRVPQKKFKKTPKSAVKSPVKTSSKFPRVNIAA